MCGSRSIISTCAGRLTERTAPGGKTTAMWCKPTTSNIPVDGVQRMHTTTKPSCNAHFGCQGHHSTLPHTSPPGHHATLPSVPWRHTQVQPFNWGDMSHDQSPPLFPSPQRTACQTPLHPPSRSFVPARHPFLFPPARYRSSPISQT